MQILPDPGLSLDDVLLVPQYTNIQSRFGPEVSLRTKITTDITLGLPIIAANMDSIMNVEVANIMAEFGGLGVLHRFMDPISHGEDLQDIVGYKVACVGVGEGGKGRADELIYKLSLKTGELSVDAVLIDVAHGDSKQVVDQIHWLKTQYPLLDVIAGNVATYSGAMRLIQAGADCIKAGVGPGSLCSTRTHTGNGVPQLTAIIECAKAVEANYGKIGLIADGGIRNGGDVIKCLAAGADAVMVGNILSGAPECPGALVPMPDGFTYKIYRGSASRAAQEAWKGTSTSVEGEQKLVPIKRPLRDILRDLECNIRSGMTYQGARSIKELKENAQFIRQTSAGYRESMPHAL